MQCRGSDSGTAARVQVLADVLRVGQAQDRVDAVKVADVLVDEERLRETKDYMMRCKRKAAEATLVLVVLVRC